MSDNLGSHMLSRQLALEGTRVIFGCRLSSQSPLMTAISHSRSHVQYLAVLHEEIAGSMAIGYAQASDRPAVLGFSHSASFINGFASLYNARKARVPLIVLVEQQESQLSNHDAVLTDDLCQLARPLAKWACELKTTEEICQVVRRAFHEALSPPKGPVVIGLPVDLLLKPAFASGITPPQANLTGLADVTFLKKASNAIINAQNPCVIVGNEVSRYRARKEAVSMVEVLGCPAFSEPIPTGVNFPNRHPQFAGVLPVNLLKASELLRNFDLILVIGMQTRLKGRSDELIQAGTTVIQLNVEPGLAGCALPCHISANGDVAESLSRLRAEVQLIGDSSWVARASAKAAETVSTVAHIRESLEESLVYPSAASKIPFVWLLRILDQMRPDKSIIVNSILSDYVNPAEILSLEGSSDYFSLNSQMEGYGMGVALGVKLASIEHTVICLTSDTKMLYYPQSLWTAAHYRLNVKFIVANSLGNENLLLRTDNLEGLRIEKPHISFSELAGAMGIPSVEINKMAQLKPAILQTFETSGPFLVDVKLQDKPTDL